VSFFYFSVFFFFFFFSIFPTGGKLTQTYLPPFLLLTSPSPIYEPHRFGCNNLTGSTRHPRDVYLPLLPPVNVNVYYQCHEGWSMGTPR
jgi:hypothetical protein